MKFIAALTSLKARLVSNDPMKFHAAVVKSRREFTTDYKLHFFRLKLELVKSMKTKKENKQTHVPISVVQHHTSHRLKTGNVLVNPNDVMIANTHSVMYMYISESL